ncbi:unnamed protein product [Leptosia nina]|uniref:Uncharacterized protein n=1 Tax=Leptosia nina TaxID=320188 RepID=A0AAV1JZ05_9NEOP
MSNVGRNGRQRRKEARTPANAENIPRVKTKTENIVREYCPDHTHMRRRRSRSSPVRLRSPRPMAFYYYTPPGQPVSLVVLPSPKPAGTGSRSARRAARYILRYLLRATLIRSASTTTSSHRGKDGIDTSNVGEMEAQSDVSGNNEATCHTPKESGGSRDSQGDENEVQEKTTTDRVTNSMSRSCAVQAYEQMSDEGAQRIDSKEECQCCVELCGCAGDIAALRASHLRLLLRHVRQLHHIERLNRAMRKRRLNH